MKFQFPLQAEVRFVPVNPYTLKIIQESIPGQEVAGVIIDPPYQGVKMFINPGNFKILKHRSHETHTIGGSYATDVTPTAGTTRVDNTDYRMRALGFRGFLVGRAPRWN